MDVKVKNQGNVEVESPALETIESDDWEKVAYPNLPKVDSPTVVRQPIPLPAGDYEVFSTGVSFKGTSKKGNPLLFLVVFNDKIGEINLMVTNEELIRFVIPETPIRILTADPVGNYTSVTKIEHV